MNWPCAARWVISPKSSWLPASHESQTRGVIQHGLYHRTNLEALTVSHVRRLHPRSGRDHPQWNRVATQVPSAGSSNFYGWLKDLPRSREWLTTRQLVEVGSHGYQILNKTFESSVVIKREDVEDDRSASIRSSPKTSVVKRRCSPTRTSMPCWRRVSPPSAMTARTSSTPTTRWIPPLPPPSNVVIQAPIPALLVCHRRYAGGQADRVPGTPRL